MPKPCGSFQSDNTGKPCRYWKNGYDYNTALCLTQLGYHKEASALLDQLPVDSRKEYLHAVVSARQGDDYLAVEHMLAVCRMNPNLVLRIPLDPELSDLIPKFFGLRMELDRIAEGK
ncbi:hypothetical protein NXX52_25000 [Bacteroides ovatus]|nr:hypothetical protein [Bacteroides ovatus]